MRRIARFARVLFGPFITFLAGILLIPAAVLAVIALAIIEAWEESK